MAQYDKTVLTARKARSISENLWGKGGTTSMPTNSAQAWVFQNSGHGGMILDAAGLSPQQRALLSEFFSPETGKVAIEPDGSIAGSVTAYGRSTVSVPASAKIEDFEFYVFEEDNAYPMAAALIQIGAKDHLKNPHFIADGKRMILAARLEAEIREEQFEKAVLVVASDRSLLGEPGMSYSAWLKMTGREHHDVSDKGAEAGTVALYGVASAAVGKSLNEVALQERMVAIIARNAVLAQPGLRMDYLMDFEEWAEETGLDTSAYGQAPFIPGTADLHAAAEKILLEAADAEMELEACAGPGI